MKESLFCIIYFEEKTGKSYLAPATQNEEKKIIELLDPIEIPDPYSDENFTVFEFCAGNIDLLSDFYKVIFGAK